MTELANQVLGQVLDRTADQRKAFIIAHDGLERRVRQLEGLLQPMPEQAQQAPRILDGTLGKASNPVEKNPPVFQTARAVRSELERLQANISRLEEKLAPALSAPTPPAGNGRETAAGVGGTSALAAEFGELLNGLEVANLRLSHIASRVEV